ncbi:MAG: peptidoglycan DD-metalloendopeptidase family protein [Methylocella sp.]
MSHLVAVYYSRFAFRLALTGLAAGMLAGCANSERLTDPFGSPFQNSAVTDPSPTASINQSAPVTPVQSRPLAPPAASLASPAPPSARVAAAPVHSSTAVAGWSAEGGTPVVLADGENADIIAKRYGIPMDALLKANGLASVSQLHPGARVIIPVYNATGAAHATASAAPPSAPVRVAADAHAQQIKLLKGKAPANAVDQAHVANKTAAPAQKLAAAKEPAKAPVAAPKAAAAAAQPVKTAAVTKQDAQKGSKVEVAVLETKKPEPEEAASEPAKAGDSANPEFRWPARGRIIQGFKAGGNDGINIAVPEGTSVKAAESGIVAYAGSELKGYGNLILIRHPNGFVSAYANNGDIEVKRGETVKRGQTIAKSGQSGNVATPQLHFELRKGATPVDPTLYLAGL